MSDDRNGNRDGCENDGEMGRDDALTPGADRPSRPARRSPDDGVTPRRASDTGADGTREPGAANLVAVVASTLGFEAGIWVVLVYVPEYLRSLGVGAPLIGAFGTLWLVGRWLGDERVGPNARRVALGAVAAAVGLTLWALVPALAGDSAALAWSLTVAGAVGIAAWTTLGPTGGSGLWPLADGGGTVTPDRPGWTLAALTASVAVLALARSFPAGFRVVLTLAATLGLTVAALWTVCEYADPAPDSASTRPRPPEGLGHVLTRFGLALVSTFVVVAVTDVLAVDVVVLGRRLAPATAFGLFLVAELGAACLTARIGPRIVATVGERAATAYAGAVAAGFPLVLVSAPSNPLFVGAVFAVFGTRTVGVVARRRTDVTVERSASRTGETYPTGRRSDTLPGSAADRRTLFVAAGPLAGGLLYAVSPVLAFGTATAVGAIGAWERTRAVADRRD